MHKMFSPSARPRAGAVLMALAVSLAGAGCAQFSSHDPLAGAKPAADYASGRSFEAAVSDWPNECWWVSYGDPQLDQLVDEALRDSPSMAVAAARMQRADAQVKVSRSSLSPQLRGNAALTEEKLSYNNLMPRNQLPQGWNDYGRIGIDLTWELDFWGRNRAALAAATSQRAAARAETAQARLGLAAAVSTDYADLARLFVVRDTAQRSLEIRNKTAELFAERFANGLETRGGLKEAESRRAVAEGELLMLDEQVALQRNRLAALLGAGPDRGLAIVRPVVSLQSGFGLPSELAVNLLGRRPDVVAARLRIDANAHGIDQKKAEFYPNVNLMAMLGLQSLGLSNLGVSGSDMGAVGPAISLPIFTAGRLQAELHEVSATYAEAVANYNGVVAHALQEVADVATSYKALSARLGKSEEALGAAAEAYQTARNRYAGGLASHLEVLYAEDNLLDRQRVLAELRSRAFALDVALKRVLGGGYQALGG